jgi:hypothetical protein
MTGPRPLTTCGHPLPAHRQPPYWGTNGDVFCSLECMAEARFTAPAHFHVGHNIPGYSPDPDNVVTYDDQDGAKAGLIDDLDRAGDSIFDCGLTADDRAIADEYSAAMEDLNLADVAAGWSVTLPTHTSKYDLGESYWIEPCREECTTWLVVENGQLRETPDTEEFPTYAGAVLYLNSRADQLESQGWTVDRSWASSGNYAAARAERGPQFPVVTLAVERDQDGGPF